MAELGFITRRAVVVDPLPDAEAQLGFQLPELGTRGEVVAQSIAGEDRLAGRQQGPGDGAALIFRNVGEIVREDQVDRIELREQQTSEKTPVSKAKRTLGTAARVTSTTVEVGGHGAATIQKLCAVLELGMAFAKVIIQSCPEPRLGIYLHSGMLSFPTPPLLRLIGPLRGLMGCFGRLAALLTRQKAAVSTVVARVHIQNLVLHRLPERILDLIR